MAPFVAVSSIALLISMTLPASADPTWTVQSTPAVDGSVLYGVACPAPDWCVAVGQHVESPSTSAVLTEIWDGSTWSIQAAPSPDGDTGDLFSSVSCVDPAFCMAVGEAQTPTGDYTLAEQWDGSDWTILPTQDASGSPTNDLLLSVACPSMTMCVAVGFSGTNPQGIAEKWNGTSWSMMSPPNPSDSVLLLNVSCPDQAFCEAVGEYYSGGKGLALAMRWNGKTWKLQHAKSPSPSAYTYLNGVSCPTTELCMSVGTTDEQRSKTFAEIWTGSGWTVKPTPKIKFGGILQAVACPTSSECIAVGQATRGTVGLAEGWDGSTWTLQTPAPIGRADLEGLTCGSPTWCEAVGWAGNTPIEPLAEAYSA